MPRRCTVCDHRKRGEIDRILVTRGESYRALAARYRLNKSSLYSHFAEHIPAEMAKAQDAKEAAAGGALLERLLSLTATTLEILAEARTAKDGLLALQAIGRAEKQIELQAKLLGEIQDATTVNVLVSPEWVAARTAILDALASHPTARLAVVRRLMLLSGDARAAG